MDIGRSELGTAVRGCWASAFSVSTLARTEAARLEPGESPMAIVVQPSIDPVFGGTARLVGTSIVITAVAGSPAPLVQGWESGVVVSLTPDGSMSGTAAIALLGRPLVRSVADMLIAANERVGATGCEWACMGDNIVVLLQVTTTPINPPVPFAVHAALLGLDAQRLARLARRSPGPLGEALVLVWAVGEGGDAADASIEPADIDPGDALRQASAGADRLVQAVWRAPASQARRRAHRILQRTRGTEPGRALAALDGLAIPDPGLARDVRALAARVQLGLVQAGEVADAATAWYVRPDRAASVLAGEVEAGRDRVGVDRWEPFVAGVVLGSGRTVEGAGASPGVGQGRLCFLPSAASDLRFLPRDVVVVTHPVPSLGAMLWDASGLVSLGGGPAAHLFEAARSIGVPAVCGAPLDLLVDEGLEAATGRYAVAVDGDAGVVAISRW